MLVFVLTAMGVKEATVDEQAVNDAATLLLRARHDRRTLPGLPEALRPRNLDEAYAVQARLVELLEVPVAGWFCACTNAAIQRTLGLNEPYYARVLEPALLPHPARLSAADLPPVVLECEFAFRLGRDLPSRPDPYTAGEVSDAVTSVHPAIEVVAGHLEDWPRQEVWSVIADNGTDGALVYGPGTRWRGQDLTRVAVSLEVNGRIERRGLGADVLGDPIAALTWLANARARDGDGLRAGQIHNTGTATDILWIAPGDRAVARFDGLGEVHLHLEDRRPQPPSSDSSRR